MILSKEIPILRGKKGVCFTLDEPKGDDDVQGSWVENVPKVLTLRPHWNYSWTSGQRLPQDEHCSHIDYLPMIWGYDMKNFHRNLDVAGSQNSKFLLGFNEPDGADQANIPVEKALDAWPELEALGLPLVSPSCVDSTGEWFQAFMEGVKERDLRVDVIGFHDYGGGNAKTLKDKLRKVHDMYQRPILITEFAPADWNAKEPSQNVLPREKVLNFMKEMLPWLEAQDWILGYAWFSFRPTHPAGCVSAFFDVDGNLTDLGKYYAEFDSKENICPVKGGK